MKGVNYIVPMREQEREEGRERERREGERKGERREGERGDF